jgi:rRNA maturation endonuclease Nob1
MPDQDPKGKVISDARVVMKTINASSVCLSCGKNFTKNMIWFEKKKFICPSCGGSIDDKPIRELLKERLIGLKSALFKRINT